MSYFKQHIHTQNRREEYRSASAPQTYAAVVGSVILQADDQIVGRDGDHLQFYLDVGDGDIYQVEINVRSANGSSTGMFFAEEDLENQPGLTQFGDPAYGIYKDASLSYATLGLKDADFVPTVDTRIESQLEGALNAAQFVSVLGFVFDDGGPGGKGVHSLHFNAANPNNDGAIAIYIPTPPSKPPLRRWFFLKFQGDHIGA